MYKDLFEIIEKYRNIIIPALESGQLELTENIIEGFLQFVHTLYQNTNYSNENNELELKNKLESHYFNHNHAAIIGIMYSFFLSAGAILSLQFGLDEVRYSVQTRMAHLANCQRNYFWNQKHTYPSIEHFKGRGVIYTAITGNYDTIHEPLIKDSRFDYILFTNNPSIKSDFWNVIYIDNPQNLDNIRLARQIKILGYKFLPEYDYSIWVDGKLQITGDVFEYIQTSKDKMPILCMPHYANNCVYEEMAACESLRKDNAEVMHKQINDYKSEGYPANYGMIDSCVLVRELKDQKLNTVMDTWWDEVLNKSYRDQLSFNYAFWKNDFVYDTSNILCYSNPYFKSYPHN